MSIPVEHKLQDVLLCLRKTYESVKKGVPWHAFADTDRLLRAIETLEQSDTKIAKLTAERDEWKQTAHELRHELAEVNWRLEGLEK
jgi:nicotinic acid phosphoribosyltransferase